MGYQLKISLTSLRFKFTTVFINKMLYTTLTIQYHQMIEICIFQVIKWKEPTAPVVLKERQ